MIEVHCIESGRLSPRSGPFSDTSLAGPAGPPLWIDLLNPTREEELQVEAALAIDLPTREEMREIEVSARLYREGDASFMTSLVVYKIDAPEPRTGLVTFILTPSTLVTVRYDEPRAFTIFRTQATAGQVACTTPMSIQVGLIEAIVEREADLIERIQEEAEKIAQSVFEMRGGSVTRTRRFEVSLKQIGKLGEISSRVRESLVSIGRMLAFASSLAATGKDGSELRQRLKIATRDVQALADHVSYVNARLSFMLDATLGLVGIEQNQIIKLFSVVAVMLMPPTLIASIYGMNFRHMPELDWPLAYPVVLLAMVLSALLPFLYFRHKGWL